MTDAQARERASVDGSLHSMLGKVQNVLMPSRTKQVSNTGVLVVDQLDYR